MKRRSFILGLTTSVVVGGIAVANITLPLDEGIWRSNTALHPGDTLIITWAIHWEDCSGKRVDVERVATRMLDMEIPSGLYFKLVAVDNTRARIEGPYANRNHPNLKNLRMFSPWDGHALRADHGGLGSPIERAT